MYIMSMVSLFILRKKEPAMQRPFKAPVYPLFPVIALVISAITLGAIIWYNLLLSLYFFCGMVIAIILFILSGKHKEILTEEYMQPVIIT